MALDPELPGFDLQLLDFVKEVSGRKIEQSRKRAGSTQESFARTVGLSARWLREVEGGNPASRLDDHLRCSQALRLPTGHILIPLMFLGHEMSFPRHLAFGDMIAIERDCIDLIAERNIRQITGQLTPRWWPRAEIAA